MELFKINGHGIITNKQGTPVDKVYLSRIIKAAAKSMDAAPERKEQVSQGLIPSLNPAFDNFTKWIDKFAPRVNKMEQPLTEAQYLELKQLVEEKGWAVKQIQGKLLDMNNWKDLTKKNASAYRTLIKWLEKDSEPQK